MFIKAALKAAYRKDFGNKDQNVDIDLEDSSGLATVYLIKTVVDKVEEASVVVAGGLAAVGT